MLLLPMVVSYRNSTSNHNKNTKNQSNIGLYLIEILHQTTTRRRQCCCCQWLYLIEILHQTTTSGKATSHNSQLYLIEILHQTTTPARLRSMSRCCILSKFYIKPQRNRTRLGSKKVVSYRNSTSNHNHSSSYNTTRRVVSYRNSTSNHNISMFRGVSIMLYLIEILHQTTTDNLDIYSLRSCILSKFYIKPQQLLRYL